MVTIIHRFKLKYVFKPGLAIVQVILFEIDCAIFYTNLHKLFV